MWNSDNIKLSYGSKDENVWMGRVDSNGWKEKNDYYKELYFSDETDFSNNLNAVLWWSKYWFRPILESLTGFYAEQTPSIWVE